MKPRVSTSAAFVPPRDDQRQHTLRVLLLDDRSAVGADAASPQLQHWREHRWHARSRLLFLRARACEAPVGRLHASTSGSVVALGDHWVLAVIATRGCRGLAVGTVRGG